MSTISDKARELWGAIRSATTENSNTAVKVGLAGEKLVEAIEERVLESEFLFAKNELAVEIARKYAKPLQGTGYFVNAEVVKTLASMGFSFNNVNISGSVVVDLSGSSFMYTDFSAADLYYADFHQSSFDNVNFTSANLASANLSGVRLIDSDFTNANVPNFDINQLFSYYGLFPYQYSSGRLKWINSIWYEYDGLNGIWIPEGSGSDYYY